MSTVLPKDIPPFDVLMMMMVVVESANTSLQNLPLVFVAVNIIFTVTKPFTDSLTLYESICIHHGSALIYLLFPELFLFLDFNWSQSPLCGNLFNNVWQSLCFLGSYNSLYCLYSIGCHSQWMSKAISSLQRAVCATFLLLLVISVASVLCYILACGLSRLEK